MAIGERVNTEVTNPMHLVDVSWLTGREAEVLGLFINSYTRIEIGQMLNMSPRTVNAHLYHIRTKLRDDLDIQQVGSRAEIVLALWTRQMTDLDERDVLQTQSFGDRISESV